MRIIVKQLQPEVSNLNEWIVYVITETEQRIEADICELGNLVSVIEKFKTKYGI